MKLLYIFLFFLSCEKKSNTIPEKNTLAPMELKLGNDPTPCQKDVPCQID